MEKQLVYNAVQCTKCGEIISSSNRHDFRYCGCFSVAVDGGLDYERRCGNDYINLSLYTDSPFEEIRKNFSRYNIYNKKYTKLMDISDDWLQNIIDYFIKLKGTNSWGFRLYLEEKLYRSEKEISI